MSLTDFYFLCAFAVMLIVYYAVPRRFQWGVILVSSIAYYLADGHPVLIICPIISICISYASAIALDTHEDEKYRKRVFTIAVIALLVSLLSFKYVKYVLESVLNINIGSPGALGIFGASGEIIIPLGLSYYTFTLIGYLADVYNRVITPRRSFLQFMSFGMYFPTMVSGPIMQYRAISEDFYAGHEFRAERVLRGFQRMLWGFFKKLLIAERLGEIVSVMYADPVSFSGSDVFIAILLFTIQLYTDFSGLMDIVLGISEAIGIDLPENFKAPYLAPTISEYWRRWHITLGVWFREYLFYPLLRTGAFGRLQDRLKNKLGKKAGKRLSTYIAMFILWFTVGLWHGGNPTFIIGSGLLHWLYIVLEELTHDPFMRLWDRWGINREAKWLNAVRIIRTFILVNIGNAFFRAQSVAKAFWMFGYAFKSHKTVFRQIIKDLAAGIADRGIRATGDITILGCDYIDLGIMVFGIIIMLAVSIISIKAGQDMRDIIAKLPTPVRYIIWFAFVFMLIFLARYGPEYSSSEFIYQGF